MNFGILLKLVLLINDTGDGTFMAEDKAILFMRYIRKHIEEVNKENPAYERKS